jgi:hypothetical protein
MNNPIYPASSNPYAAPDAALDVAVIDENDWASVIRAEFAREEKSVKHLTWLNFLFGVLCVPYALIGVAVVCQILLDVQAWQSPNLAPLLLLCVTCGFLVLVNIWIWYALRRFSPWAWRIDLGMAFFGCGFAFVVLGVGLWLEAPYGSPFLVALLIALPSLLILRVLSTKRVRRLFQQDYQQAIRETRRRPH